MNYVSVPSLQSETEILQILRETGAFFDKGHYILASGRHSEQYIFARLAVCLRGKRVKIARLIARCFKNDNINVVAAFSVGGALLGMEVAKLLCAKFVVGRKTERGDVKFENLFKIEQCDTILIVDDVLTTGGTINKALDAIKAWGKGAIIGIGVIVDRSRGNVDFGDVKLVRLVEFDLDQYDAKRCPLCKKGIKATDLSHVESDRDKALSVLSGRKKKLMTIGFNEYEKLLKDASLEVTK